MWRWVRRLGWVAGLAVVGVTGGLLTLPGCLATPPAIGSVSGVDRLSRLDGDWPGLAGETRIYWDERLIPSIHAPNDQDIPYAMGLVHAHLRGAQMDMLRRVSQGRVAEMVGPIAAGIDAGLRAVDLGRAAGEMAEALPLETRAWMDRYVAGINAYRARWPQPPADARALAIDVGEPFSVEDVLTIGRLASVDINWGRWLSVLTMKDELGYREFAARLAEFAAAGRPSFGAEVPTPLDLLIRNSKAGSNAFVIAGDRTASGAGLMASDPHLGLPQPNIWCVVGYRTPTSAAVGLTIPGVPLILVGRNETIAWSGTNMQAPSSMLVDLPDGWRVERAREESIGVRFWFDRTQTIRESAHGPVITDAKALKRLGEGDIAFRWRGHGVSDETSTFLRIARARSWEEFRAAFATYAVSGQNFLYADKAGNIGQLLAYELIPAAVRAAGIGPVDPEDPRFSWGGGIPSTELPAAYNPDRGYLVSANNTPLLTDPPIVQQGNSNDRVERMAELIESNRAMTVDDARAIQTDTYSASSHACARVVSVTLGDEALTGSARELVESMAAWDGRYEKGSTGAVAYQALMATLIDAAYEGRYGDRIRGLLRSAPYAHDFVRQDVERGDISAATLAAAAESAAAGHDPSVTWGDIHRIRVAHPIGRVPVVGKRYVFANIPSGGSTSTIHKSAHGLSGSRHEVYFGANARIVCDLAELDANRVALLGGQDGWMGSDRLLDQVPMWTRGELAPLPLSAEAQRGRAVRTTRLLPSGAP